MNGSGVWAVVGVAAMALVAAVSRGQAADDAAYVRVSPRDPRYFELSDGSPYVPIGLNLASPPKGTAEDPEAALAGMEAWLAKLAANSGTYARVWLSQAFWDVEHERCGQMDTNRAVRIDRLLDMAGRHGVRLKLCLEHFRAMNEDAPPWAVKPLYLQANGGPAASMADFIDGEQGRAQFRSKLAWYATRYGSKPGVFGWELWNEMDCIRGGDWESWTSAMLGELHRLFPRNLAMQSLGSFDTADKRSRYFRLACMRCNDVAQVHRYLDPGAGLDVCRGAVDVLAADAVRELVAFTPGKPVLLAESGAVESRHTGPSKLYAADKAGTILHDVLFAPFFAGAAGPGQIWHWDAYVDANNLWHHFARFAEAIGGVDPAGEDFAPSLVTVDRVKVYTLRGRHTLLVWCRDARNDWMSELRDGKQPEPVEGFRLGLAKSLEGKTPTAVRVFDPWTGRWTTARAERGPVTLPAFTRSTLLRVDY